MKRVRISWFLALLVSGWPVILCAQGNGSLHYSLTSTGNKAFTQQSWYVSASTLQYARYCPAGQLLVLRQAANLQHLELMLPPGPPRELHLQGGPRSARFWIWFPSGTQDPLLLDANSFNPNQLWQNNGRLRLELGKAAANPQGIYLQLLPYRGKVRADLYLNGNESWLESIRREAGLLQPVSLVQLRSSYPELNFAPGMTQLWDINGERWLVRLFTYPSTENSCREPSG